MGTPESRVKLLESEVEVVKAYFSGLSDEEIATMASEGVIFTQPLPTETPP